MVSRITRSSWPRSERVTDASVTIARARFDLEAVTRAVGAAGIAGVLVGVPAGLLSRVVMKVSALRAGPTVEGHLTENGAVVGALTADGTLFLVMFAGLAPALSAANLYLVVRPWLLPFGRWSGIAFGLYVLALAGPVVLDPFNVDFIRFGPTELTVAMFCALFIAVGIALVPATNFTLTRLARRRVALVALGFGLAGFDALLLVGVAIGAVSTWLTGGVVPIFQVAVILVVLSVAIALIARRRGVSRASYVAVAAPLAVGVWFTGAAIATLLR